MSPAPVALDCPRDLEFAASFLLANDAGIGAHGWAAYPDHVARGLAEERAAAPAASTPERCALVIERFFRHVRKGHFGAHPVSQQAGDGVADPGPPPRIEVRRLSPSAVYLMVPSFEFGIREQLEQAIARDEGGLRSARQLVIDVRRNGGGSDSAYGPVLPLLGPATYRSAMPDVLVTEGTLSGWRSVLGTIPASEEGSRRVVAKLVDRMTAAWQDPRRGIAPKPGSPWPRTTG